MPTDTEIAKRVAQRIAGRELFEEVYDQLPADESDPLRQGFMDRAKRCFTVQQIDPQAMSDEAARDFGRRYMGFGAHADKTYDDCPLEYLIWLAESSRGLMKYLRSRRIREEREGDADD